MLKKCRYLFLTTALFCCALNIKPTEAWGMQLVVDKNEPIEVFVDYDRVVFSDALPFIDENSRTQVPVTAVCEAFGASVDWQDEGKTVTITTDEINLAFVIGSRDYALNDETKTMDTEARIVSSRTYVPAKYIAEAFGVDVRWNGKLRTVYMSHDYPYSTFAGQERLVKGIYGNGLLGDDVLSRDELNYIEIYYYPSLKWQWSAWEKRGITLTFPPTVESYNIQNYYLLYDFDDNPIAFLVLFDQVGYVVVNMITMRISHSQIGLNDGIHPCKGYYDERLYYTGEFFIRREGAYYYVSNGGKPEDLRKVLDDWFEQLKWAQDKYLTNNSKFNFNSY